MSKKLLKLSSYTLAFLATGFIFSSCKDDTNTNPGNPVSRLYVSTADTDPSTANLEIYDPADGVSLSGVAVNTGAKDGNGIIVNASGDTIYQLSRTNKTIYKFANNGSLTGSPSPAGSFADASLTSGRDMAYDETGNVMYVANNTDSTIRVYTNFRSLTGNVTGRVLKLSGQPWGVHFDKAGNRLLVLIDLAGLRVDVLNNPSSIPAGIVTPNSSLNITDRPNNTKTRFHGLTYSSSANVLIVSEIGEAAAPTIPDPTKPAFNADGGIYIIEGASAKLATGGNIAATRVIYGAATQLGNPVDVAIDDRPNKMLIYAAEKANKRILVFKLSDNGNVAPTNSATTSRLPESLYLYTN